MSEIRWCRIVYSTVSISQSESWYAISIQYGLWRVAQRQHPNRCKHLREFGFKNNIDYFAEANRAGDELGTFIINTEYNILGVSVYFKGNKMPHVECCRSDGSIIRWTTCIRDIEHSTCRRIYATNANNGIQDEMSRKIDACRFRFYKQPKCNGDLWTSSVARNARW